MAMSPMDLQSYWRGLPYFHENFKSTEEVSRFIKRKAKGKACYYLLRPSNRDRNLLTASILCKDQSVRHTHIFTEPNGSGYKYFLVVEKKFDSIEELIYFYEKNPVKNLENVSDVFFRYAIQRDDAHCNTNGSTGGSLRQMPSRSTSLSSLSSSSSLNRFPSRFDESIPPLPQRPRTTSSGSSGTLDLTPASSAGSMSNLPRMDSIASRPPLPLPIPNKPEEGQVYVYSKARDVDEDLSERLKEVLKSNERCECGIPRVLAELPLGWTVHKSKDALTMGKLFYQNEHGLTSWSMPQEVKQQLTKIHIQNLKTIDKNWRVPH